MTISSIIAFVANRTDVSGGVLTIRKKLAAVVLALCTAYAILADVTATNFSEIFPDACSINLLIIAAMLYVLIIRFIPSPTFDRVPAAVSVFFGASILIGDALSRTEGLSILCESWKHILLSCFAFAGWSVLAYLFIRELYLFLDRITSNTTPQSENLLEPRMARYSVIAFTALALFWLPYIIGYAPALFLGDTPDQIAVWFNMPDRFEEAMPHLNPNIHLNDYHPVAHTALVGCFVELGLSLFSNENIGIFLYVLAQSIFTIAVLTYSLRVLLIATRNQILFFSSLAFFCFVPVFGNYAVLVTKDVLYSDLILLFIVQLFEILPTSGARRLSQSAVMRLFLTCVFLLLFRHGSLLVIVPPLLLFAIFNPALRKTLATICLGAAAIYLSFSGILLPAMGISPGSIREALSIPFQQTARYVTMHPDEVTQEEEKAIGNILAYDELAERYIPYYSDHVKDSYNWHADNHDLQAYFIAWAEMGLKHPETYTSAALSKCYGYFYFGHDDLSRSYMYTLDLSKYCMDLPLLEEYRDTFSFQSWESFKLVDFSHKVIEKYEFVLFARTPILQLFLAPSTYVWVFLILCAYLIHRKRYNLLIPLTPLAIVLIVNCVLGPCDGTFYFRYALPIALSLPIVLPLFLLCQQKEHPRQTK